MKYIYTISWLNTEVARTAKGWDDLYDQLKRFGDDEGWISDTQNSAEDDLLSEEHMDLDKLNGGELIQILEGIDNRQNPIEVKIFKI